ncbi:MAG: dihydrodipicolinate synthase family protein [Myxococcota bacterium]
MQFYVALLTPFDTRGRVDLARLRAHVLWLAAQGVDGFVPTGTTGEFLYLSDREREAIHRTVLDAARGRPVYPCTWDPSQATTSFLTEAARDQGAAGVLLPPPVYYEVDDRVARAWYETTADKNIAVLAYHHPRHLKTRISPSLYDDLRASGLVSGLMDCSEDPHRLRRMAAPDPGTVFAGGDRLIAQAPKIADLGAFVSSIANVWPSFCMRLFRSGESQLEDALIDRVNRIRGAGGLRALKALLRMGCRSPLIEPLDAELIGLPPAEGP